MNISDAIPKGKWVITKAHPYYPDQAILIVVDEGMENLPKVLIEFANIEGRKFTTVTDREQRAIQATSLAIPEMVDILERLINMYHDNPQQFLLLRQDAQDVLNNINKSVCQ